MSTIPVGGTTGLCHVHSAAVEAAAEWLSLAPREQIGRPVVPSLKARFGLSTSEAVEAVREANMRRARAL